MASPRKPPTQTPMATDTAPAPGPTPAPTPAAGTVGTPPANTVLESLPYTPQAAAGMPPGYPMDPTSGEPIEPFDMPDDQRRDIVARYGGFDVKSIKSNYSTSLRMKDKAEGISYSQRPWRSQGQSKYDAIMQEVIDYPDTKVYLERISPNPTPYKAPPATMIPTFADMHAWLCDNIWNGQTETVRWTIRGGERQMGTDKFPLHHDPEAVIRYQNRLAEMRAGGLGPAGVAPAPRGYLAQRQGEASHLGDWTPPPAAPAAPPASHRTPPADPPWERPVQPVAGLYSREEVERQLAAERQRWQAEEQARQAQQEALREANNLRATIASLESRLEVARQQGQTQDPRYAAIEDKVRELDSQLASLGQAPTRSRAHQSVGGWPAAAAAPSPPPMPKAPPGWRCLFDPATNAYEMIPVGGQAPAQIAQEQAAPVSQPARQEAARPFDPFQGFEDGVDAFKRGRERVVAGMEKLGLLSAEQGSGATGMLGGLFPQLPPRASSELADEKVEKEEDKKPVIPNLVDIGGGLKMRVDKETGELREEFGLADAVANAGPILEFGKWFLERASNAQKEEIDNRKATLQLEREALELEERKAILQKTRAETLVAQQKAFQSIGGVPESSPGGSVVRSEDDPSE